MRQIALSMMFYIEVQVADGSCLLHSQWPTTPSNYYVLDVSCIDGLKLLVNTRQLCWHYDACLFGMLVKIVKRSFTAL